MQRVARMERKVTKQRAMTAPKTHSTMGRWAEATTSLVAAITPALPLARRNFALGDGCSAAKAFTASVTARSVSALWSARKIMIGITLASALSKPVAVSMGETAWARGCE